MSYKLLIPSSVEKEINKLPDEIVNQILSKLNALSKNPISKATKN